MRGGFEDGVVAREKGERSEKLGNERNMERWRNKRRRGNSGVVHLYFASHVELNRVFFCNICSLRAVVDFDQLSGKPRHIHLHVKQPVSIIFPFFKILEDFKCCGMGG